MAVDRAYVGIGVTVQGAWSGWCDRLAKRGEGVAVDEAYEDVRVVVQSAWSRWCGRLAKRGGVVAVNEVYEGMGVVVRGAWSWWCSRLAIKGRGVWSLECTGLMGRQFAFRVPRTYSLHYGWLVRPRVVWHSGIGN